MLKSIRKKIVGLPNYLNYWIRTFKGGLTLICLLIFIIIPLLTQNFYNLGVLITGMVFTIYAASWDFLAGIAGQVSFGHAIFFGIAAYGTSAYIMFLNYPWWIALLIGSLIATICGFFFSIPFMRLKGPYLALGTLATNLILLSLFSMGELKDIFWGTEGITGVPNISRDMVMVYYIIFLIMVISLIILIAISKSKLGTILKSIRDDETGAEISGINTTKYKMIAFLISAFFAGIAGSLFALQNYGATPVAVYGTLISFYAIIMASLGGITTISGAALGAFFFTLFQEGLRYFEDIPAAYPVLIFSIILILVIRFTERGILVPLIERLKDLWDLVLGR